MPLSRCVTLIIYYIEFCHAFAPLEPLDPKIHQDADPDLMKYIQPNDADSGRYDNVSTAEAERLGICTRPCDGAKPMVCYFVFTLENYATVGPACGDCLKGEARHCRRKGCITADGFERAMLSINRQLPGPAIQVCRGDTIVVDVRNHMLDREVTIHWHGVYMKETPWMDGVPMVTQCPIPCATTFRYKFPALPAGTFFYHSHTGLQKMDGLEGALIIRVPRTEDGSSALYDFDLPSHVIILADWMHSMADSMYPGNTHNDTRIEADALLINGQNQIVGDAKAPRVPMHFFNVKRDKKYRFRLIGGSCLACPLILTVENHQLQVVALDGTSVEPFYVDSVTMFPGDRTDVVIHTNQTDNLYWIQVKTMCSDKTAEAVLQYEGQKLMYVSQRPNAKSFQRGRSLNAMDMNPHCSPNNSGICLSQIKALTTPVNPVVLGTPTHHFLVPLDEYFFQDLGQLFWKDDDRYHRFFQSAPVILTHLINNRSFMFPPFPPLTQSDPLPPNLVCPPDDQCANRINVPGKGLCECFNVIQVPLGAVAEVIFIDWGGAQFYHPNHLHGTDMFVREQGTIPAGMDNQAFVNSLRDRLAKEADAWAKNDPKPCVKDTVTIPPQGYAVVRIHFNNPGFWLCHCHYIMHSDTGMTMVFQVGDRKDFVPPPADFPKCNLYKSKVDPHEYANIDWNDEPTALN